MLSLSYTYKLNEKLEMRVNTLYVPSLHVLCPCIQVVLEYVNTIAKCFPRKQCVYVKKNCHQMKTFTPILQFSINQ